MRYFLWLSVFSVFVFFSAMTSAAEQVETLGPQLISEGNFMGSDGGDPPAPAGWEIRTGNTGSALWLEKGFRDNGCVNLTSRSADGHISIQQRRWVAGNADCYLLSFYWTGKGVWLSVSLSVIDQQGNIVSSSVREYTSSGGWKLERIFLQPFPADIEGEIVTNIEAHGEVNYKIDHVALSSYKGPYTRRERSKDGYMVTSPKEGESVRGAQIFTWRAAQWAKAYRIEISDGSSVYHRQDSLVNACEFEPKAGKNSWRVVAIPEKGEERVILEPISFTAEKDGKQRKNAQNPTGLPHVSTEYLTQLKGTSNLCFYVEKIQNITLPDLKFGKLPQAETSVLQQKKKVNESWQQAADLLLRCNVLLKTGAGSVKELGAKIVCSMETAYAEKSFELSSQTASLVALSLISCSHTGIEKGKASKLYTAIIPKSEVVSRRALSEPGKLSAARFAAINYIAMRYGMVKAEPGIREAYISSASYWFGDSAGIPASILATDLPIHLAASKLLEVDKGCSSSSTISRSIQKSFVLLGYDFPLFSRSSGGFSSFSSAQRAASLLAFAASFANANIPHWMLAASGEDIGYTGMYPISIADGMPLRAFETGEDGGLLCCYSPLLDLCGSLTFRASPYGTAYPFGASQGSFTFSHSGVPFVGLLPVYSESYCGSSSYIPSRFFQTYQSERLAQENGSYETDAKLLSSSQLGSVCMASADLTPSSPDFIRNARRNLVLISPPGAQPVLLCRDVFSNYYDARAISYFRMLGNLEIDSAFQTIKGVSNEITMNAIVAFPEGSEISASGGATKSEGFDTSSFRVVYPKEAKDSLVGFFPSSNTGIAPVISEDYRGIRSGADLFIFSKGEGAVYMADPILTDADFIAFMQLTPNKYYAFVQNATTFDWMGNSVLLAKGKVSAEIIFTWEKERAEVVSVATTNTVSVFGVEYSSIAESNSFSGVKSKRIKVFSDLYMNDIELDAIEYTLKPGLTLVCVPFLLCGNYEISAEVSGTPNSRASFRFAGKYFIFDCKDRAKTKAEFSANLIGSTCATFLLEDGVEVKSLKVKARALTNGGMENWKNGLPEGFSISKGSEKPKESKSKVLKGKKSLFVALTEKQQMKLDLSMPVSKKLSISARVFVDEPTESSSVAYIEAVYVDNLGNILGKPEVGKESKVSGKWAKISLSARVPKKAVMVRVSIIFKSISGKTSAWIDEISVED